MRKFLTIGLIITAVLLALGGGACSKAEPTATTTTPTATETPQQIAEDFVKAEATYVFDGMPETLELTGSNTGTLPWTFTFGFDSRHAGYGDRTGGMLAQVITRHTAVITVENGKVTLAVMDGVYDMFNQKFLKNIEIRPAPIDEVNILFMESYPVQVGVYIKGGLPDGCTTFRDLTTNRDNDTITIDVTIQKPGDAMCPAIYTWFEKNVNLGSDFTSGTTYTVKVNDVTTTFVYP
jgi:hypothetical protein